MCCLDMSRLEPAESMAVDRLVLAYIFIRIFQMITPVQYFLLRRKFDNVKKVQDKTLLAILKANANTEYGIKYDWAGIKTREEFVDKHPLVSYEHFRDDIEREIKGENNVLTTTKVDFIAMSSGTTGKNKYFLFGIPRIGMVMVYYLGIVGRRMLTNLKRHALFSLSSKVSLSPSGIRMGALSMMNKPSTTDIVPPCRVKVHTEITSYHMHAVFLLQEREVGKLEAFSSHLFYSFLKYMETNWSVICDDIERGKLRDDIGFEEDTYQQLNKYLRPNPTRAAELRPLIAAGTVGFVRRIWPGIDHIMMAKSGGFSHCANILMESYLKGVPVSWGGHLASEGLIGIRFDEDFQKDIYFLVPDMLFLEFIPEAEMNDETPTTLFMDQV